MQIRMFHYIYLQCAHAHIIFNYLECQHNGPVRFCQD